MFSYVKLLFTILFLLFALSQLPAQKKRVLENAENFFNTGFYYDAITEYKRFLCFYQESKYENEDLSEAYYKIGIAYRFLEEFERAEKYLKKSIVTSGYDRSKNKRRYALAVVQAANREYSAATFGLLKLTMFAKDNEVVKKANLILALCFLNKHNWLEARQAFKKYFNYENDPAALKKNAKIIAVLDKTKNLKYKSPQLAKWLSTFIPGAGQVYGGKYWNGFNALLINVAAGSVVLKDLRRKAYQESFVDFMFLFNRFYKGNKHNAEHIARRYNKKLDNRIVAEIIKILAEE